MSNRAVTRARNPGKDPRTEEALRECIALMTSGQWVTGASTTALATKYGVCVDTVQKWGAEASRYITRALGDHDEIRARWTAQLESLHSEARASGEYGAAVSAIATAAKVTGLDKSGGTTVNVGTSLVGHPEYEQLKSMVRRVMERFPETVQAFREEWDALRMDE